MSDQKQLEQLVDLFLAENVNVNLSALRTKEQCYVGNVLDSLSFIDILPKMFIVKKDDRTILDLGTGGGFPLLPLALELSGVHFIGLDATRKKIDAVRRIASQLELSNVDFLVGRSEEIAHHPDHRGRYDVVTARAVAPLNVLLELSIPFCTVGGHCVFWKSMHVADEMRMANSAIEKLNASLTFAHEYELPDGFGKRQLLVYEKMAPTEERYPRSVGMPKKDPL